MMGRAIIGVLLFLISEMGWMEFFRQKTKLRACFVPVCLFSLQTLLLILCAAAGVLKLPAQSMYYAGFALCPLNLLKSRKSCFTAWRREGLLLSLAGIALAFALLYGKVAGHFDNFTHWAVIVKHLLSSHALPSAADAVITYTNYPVGSAMWIYYAVSCIGVTTEDMWLLAQSIYMIFCIQTLFVIAEKTGSKIRQLMISAVVLVYGNFALSYNIPIYNLLVDTILPLHGVALTLFTAHECCRYENNRLSVNKALTLNLWGLIPLLCMTTQIKVSGAVFLVLPIVLVIWAACRTGFKQHLWALIATGACIALCLLGWNLRHTLIFGADGGKHAVSLSVFQENREEVAAIAYGVLHSMFSGKDMLYLLAPLTLSFAASMLADEVAVDAYLKVLTVCVSMYVLYTIGLLGMYLFSMPRQEALVLAGFTRYQRSMLIWLHAILYLSILFSFSRLLPAFTQQKWVSKAAAGLAVIILVSSWWAYSWKPYGFKTLADDYRCEELTMRIELENVLQQENIAPGGKYLLLLPESKDSSYYRLFYGCLLSYLTNSADVTVSNAAEANLAANPTVIRLPE